MYKILTASLLGVTTLATDDDWVYRYQGSGYHSWDAKPKFNRLVNELEADKTGIAEYPYEKVDDLFRQRSNRTTCVGADELPDQKSETGERRQKLIHGKGVVGTVRLVPKKQRKGRPVYTGIFEGAEYGILRMSDAGFLAQNPDEAKLWAPSVAIKFLVDGKKSVNLLTQVNFDGVEDPYFFANSFTNHPPRSVNECMIETTEKKFAEATQFTFSTGTGHLATVKQDGTKIEAEDALFPYEVILVPNREEFKEEYVDEDENMLDYFVKYGELERDSKNRPKEITLFKVKARHDPSQADVAEEDLPTIAEIRLTSDLYRSTFGDERLFFQHETINRDLSKLHKQGDEGIARAKEWKEMIEKHKRHTEDDTWNRPVRDLADDDANGAMDKIEAGMLGEHLCPFAWFLNLVN